MLSVREEAKDLKKKYDKTEDDLKALQSVGQIIGEVLRRLDDERCKPHSSIPDPISSTSFCSFLISSHVLSVIVKASSGPRYVVGCRSKVGLHAQNAVACAGVVILQGSRSTTTEARVYRLSLNPIAAGAD